MAETRHGSVHKSPVRQRRTRTIDDMSPPPILALVQLATDTMKSAESRYPLARLRKTRPAKFGRVRARPNPLALP